MRLQQIEARLKEIQGEVEKRGAELSTEEIAAFEGEVTKLKEERAALIAGNEQRKKLLDDIADGSEEPERRKGFPDPTRHSPAEERTGEDKYSTIEYRRAFMEHVLRGNEIPAEYRADAITHTTDVGAIIPTTTINTIIEKMEKVGNIQNLVTKTAYKGGVQIPKSSVKPVATWVAEGAGSDKQKKTVGFISFAYHKLRCAVAVTLETDAMALSAFETTLINNVVTAMTKAVEEAIINGDGNGKPSGILKETVITDQVVTTAALDYQTLIDAEAALPEEYEGNAKWCMSKKTFMGFVGMTDAGGQPIARTNYGLGGKPERVLLGREVVLCQHVPSFSAAATGDVFAFLFDFESYVLNTNYTMGIKKYEDNETDDLVTKAVMLVDGKVTDNNSLVVVEKQ